VGVERVLESEGVEHAVEVVVGEGHRHRVAHHVLVLNERARLRAADARHVRRVVQQREVCPRLEESQVAVGARAGLEHVSGAEPCECFAVLVDGELVVAAFEGVHDGVDGEGGLLVGLVEVRCELVGGDELLDVAVDLAVLVVLEVGQSAQAHRAHEAQKLEHLYLIVTHHSHSLPMPRPAHLEVAAAALHRIKLKPIMDYREARPAALLLI